MITCCTTQGTLLRAMWWPKWEGNPKKRGICICIGKGNSLQYSCLKNPMDRGALQAQSVGHDDWLSMYMYSWFTLCIGETNTPLYSNYTPTEINFKKKRADPTSRAHSLIILEKAKFPTWKALLRLPRSQRAPLKTGFIPVPCTLLSAATAWCCLCPEPFPGLSRVPLPGPAANHPNFWSWEPFSQFIISSYFSNLITFCLFSHSVMSNSLWSHGLLHARLPCPSLSPGVYSNSCPLSQWCRPTISSSVIPCSHLQSFPASGPFPMSQLFVSGGQSIGASASVLPMNIQDWFPLGWTGLISLLSKGFSRVFLMTFLMTSSQFKSINSLALSLLYGPTLTSVHDHWKNHSFDYTELCRQCLC